MDRRGSPGVIVRATQNAVIGLALSGGGIRAMAFHCGVLRWLAETRRLESIAHISSVSGGTLSVGLIFRLSAWAWPTSEAYLARVGTEMRKALTTKNVVLHAAALLVRPKWWKYALS